MQDSHSGANYTAALCGRARIKGSNSARPVGLADTLSVSDATAWAGAGAVQGSRRRLNLMPDNSQVDDEREPLTDDEIEKLAHPTSGVRRYDRRAVAQSVREQRKREPELRKIDRSNRKMAELLEGRDDLASMRLLFEINERQRDRIMGKPFVSDPPSKSKARGFQDNRLELAVQELIMPGNAALEPAAPKQLEPAQSELPEAQSESPSKVDGLPESTERQLAELRELSRRLY